MLLPSNNPWTSRLRQLGIRLAQGLVACTLLVYSGICIFFFVRQEALLYDSKLTLETVPSDQPFQLPFQTVKIPVGSSSEHLNSWWVPAPQSSEDTIALPEEPHDILTEPKVILYFNGRAGNKGSRSHLERVKGFRQLGFSVLLVDYRGYGNSSPRQPSEASLYEDSQAAWRYLTQTRRMAAHQIVIYGESLGGAVALDLAVKQPNAAGVIVQSSFTTLPAAAREMDWFRYLPVDWILTQRFNSLAKVRSLKTPVLFLHGTADQIVPVWMSHRLYQAVPSETPKELVIVPDASHFRIYRPGQHSYLKAIQRLVTKMQ
ncbi:alpha/beta hydrolase [Acaryochloris marina]|uniref:Peptidase S9 prolyl oligopeptidase catalytic domain-containing protein n=1 Tax=Acaryochloris marina (strain MBIC 11017) TaxID=329726 RepID=B0C6U3_ACAM1|nr:alpha/beta hydrolase [Acaryochloris marina]ABW27647.1 conserved hypothetical protein [Acaryochloris marina MBIC11017]BDM82382.1 phospholipase [Acaryochloris marina MBIC10699]